MADILQCAQAVLDASQVSTETHQQRLLHPIHTVNAPNTEPGNE